MSPFFSGCWIFAPTCGWDKRLLSLPCWLARTMKIPFTIWMTMNFLRLLKSIYVVLKLCYNSHT